MNAKYLKLISLSLLLIITFLTVGCEKGSHTVSFMGGLHYSHGDETGSSVSGKPDGASGKGILGSIKDALLGNGTDTCDEKTENSPDGKEDQIDRNGVDARTDTSEEKTEKALDGKLDHIDSEKAGAKIDTSKKKEAKHADRKQDEIGSQHTSERREPNNKRNNDRDSRSQFTLSEIKELTAADLSDDLIITKISSASKPYELSTADIISLKRAKVRDRVISCLINTSE